ncbi:MAG TPA: Rpn family recombination-promoting nuclease/putative transposase [Candidatus Avisuccinivibrio pullicola]|nr:Rpn family recombination-promoting nuclease/putative transposase [Candidatus Avisuccinivibrio pullicola]
MSIKTVANNNLVFCSDRKITNRFNDVLWKFMFGSEERKTFLLRLLNDLFASYPAGSHIVIEDLTYRNVELQPDHENGKRISFDIVARTSDGKDIDIEVQRANMDHLTNRLFYYLTRLHAGKLHAGDDYDKLTPSIVICFMDFSLKLPDSVPHQGYIRRYQMTEALERDVITEDGEIFLVEVPKWLKEQSQIPLNKQPRIVRWLTYLTAKDDKTVEELVSKDKDMQEVVMAESVFVSDDNRWLAYVMSEKAERDEQARLHASRKEGIVEGIAITASNMLRDGVDHSLIKKYTGLSDAQISELQQRVSDSSE